MCCSNDSIAPTLNQGSYQTTGEETMPLIGEQFAPGFKLVIVPFGMVMLAFGVIGNGFLLVVLGTQPSMWKVHNIFIVTLTFADLLVVCSGLPFQVIDIITGVHPVANVFHCKVNGFACCLGFSVSVMSLVCVSFNRFLKVCHTRLFGRLFSVRKNVVLCVAMWPLAVGLLIPLLLGDTTFGYDPRSHACTIHERHPTVNYRSVVMLGLLVVPPAVIGYFNFKIFQCWKESKKRSNRHLTSKELRPQVDPSSTSMNVEHGSSVETITTASQDSKVKGALTDSTVQTSASEGTPESGAVSRTAKDQSPKAILNEAAETSAARAEVNRREKEETGVPGNPFWAKKVLSFSNLTDEVSTSCAVSTTSSSGQHPRPKPKGKYCKVSNPRGRSYLSKVRSRVQKTVKVKSYRGEFALVRSLLTVAICLFVLYLPYALCLVLNLYVVVHTEIMILGTMFLFTNCSINWIIYGAMNTSFRKAYRNTLRAFYMNILRAFCPCASRQNVPQEPPESSCTGSRSSLCNKDSAAVAASPC